MSTEAKKAKSLWWFEPSWSFRPRLMVEFTRVLHPWMWARVFIVALLLVILLASFVKRAVPDLEFDWTYAFIEAFGLFVLGLVAFFAVCWFIRPIVSINAKGVNRQEGSHVVWRLRPDIRRIILDWTDPERPRLCVEAAGKEAVDYGIASKIGLDSLAAFLRETFPDLNIEERR